MFFLFCNIWLWDTNCGHISGYSKKLSTEFEAEGEARFPAFRLGWGQNILFWKEHCQSKKFCTTNFQRKEAGTRKKCLCFVNRKLSFFSCNIVDQEAKHALENSADRSGTRPPVCVVWFSGIVGRNRVGPPADPLSVPPSHQHWPVIVNQPLSILWHTIVPANLLLARKKESSQQHLSQHQPQLCTQVCLSSRLADNSWFSMLTLCPLKCHIHLPPCLPKLALEQRPQGHVPSWRLDGTDPYGRPLAASLRKTGRGHLRSRPDMKVGKTAPLTTFDARDRDRLALAWEMLSCSLRGPSPICPSVYSVMRKYNIILNPFMATSIQMLLQKLCWKKMPFWPM